MIINEIKQLIKDGQPKIPLIKFARFEEYLKTHINPAKRLVRLPNSRIKPLLKPIIEPYAKKHSTIKSNQLISIDYCLRPI